MSDFIVTAAAPDYSTLEGKEAAPSLTTDGRVRVDAGGGSDTSNVNIVSVGGTTVANPLPVGPAASGLASNAPNNVTTTAYAASGIIKNAPGVLYGLSGYNSGQAQFILLFDAAAVPADTAQAVVVIAANAQGNFSYDPGIYGRKFLVGICWSNSTTAPTKTIGSTNVFLDAQLT